RSLRGVRERRPAAARPGLRPPRRRARLPPGPGTGGAARPDPLAVDAPRHRWHLPEARERRRGLRAQRAADRRHAHPVLSFAIVALSAARIFGGSVANSRSAANRCPGPIA